MTGKLARVDWQMGQTLLPEQLVAQEDALAQEALLRSRLRGLPAYGIGALRWNDSLLSEGVVSLQAATVVFPTGLLVDVPDNATATPVNLNISGTAQVTVFLHCLDKVVSSRDDEGDLGGDERGVVRRVYQLMLSTEQVFPHAIETMKLGEFGKDPTGVWNVLPSYFPPLLQVGSSPFLRDALAELPGMLEAFQYKLAIDSASYLSGTSLLAVRQCLKSLYRLQRLLGNLQREIRLHPYYVLEIFKDFYVDVCFYRDASPQHIAAPYRHDHLAQCFSEVLDPLREQMQLAEEQSPYQPFEFQEGVYRIEFPREIQEAKEVYLLVQKPKVSAVVRLENLKLAAPSRLPMIHRLALKGISSEKVEQPVLSHTFGPEVEFYQLKKGEEWSAAVRENAAAFYYAQGYEKLEFYLYWFAG
ncbi:MAG: type VI secretion system baseplate subunit TssK [Deltaproteobacteria bacterium]|nr:type VI secretion system baseplate subunit TssK [Deltaproteobacteria bacterium]